MGFFTGLDELAGLLRRMIAEPAWRCALAEAGRARYQALFNETVVAEYMVNVAFGTHDPSCYEWPTLTDA